MDTAKKLADALRALVNGHFEHGGLMAGADAWYEARDVLAAHDIVLSTPAAADAPNCTTCNDQGSVGRPPDDYFPCPDCTPQASAPEPVSAALRGLIAAIDAAGYSTEFQGNLARAERALASAPEPVAQTDAWCDAIIRPIYGTAGTAQERALVRAALAASQPAPVEAKARPDDDALWDQTLKERDEYHEWADLLAARIALITGVDIGEHSSANCPWAKAINAAEYHLAAPTDDDWKIAFEAETSKFQVETLRASRLHGMLMQWVKRHEAEHPSGPGTRSCEVCRLVKETNALLSTPVQAQAVAVPEGWKLYALPNDWIPGANIFKDWCGQFFGPDSDDGYLLEAVKALLTAAPTPSKGEADAQD